jgi:hypothetical protein
MSNICQYYNKKGFCLRGEFCNGLHTELEPIEVGEKEFFCSFENIPLNWKIKKLIEKKNEVPNEITNILDSIPKSLIPEKIDSDTEENDEVYFKKPDKIDINEILSQKLNKIYEKNLTDEKLINELEHKFLSNYRPNLDEERIRINNKRKALNLELSKKRKIEIENQLSSKKIVSNVQNNNDNIIDLSFQNDIPQNIQNDIPQIIQNDLQINVNVINKTKEQNNNVNIDEKNIPTTIVVENNEQKSNETNKKDQNLIEESEEVWKKREKEFKGVNFDNPQIPYSLNYKIPRELRQKILTGLLEHYKTVLFDKKKIALISLQKEFDFYDSSSSKNQYFGKYKNFIKTK